MCVGGGGLGVGEGGMIAHRLLRLWTYYGRAVLVSKYKTTITSNLGLVIFGMLK